MGEPGERPQVTAKGGAAGGAKRRRRRRPKRAGTQVSGETVASGSKDGASPKQAQTSTQKKKGQKQKQKQRQRDRQKQRGASAKTTRKPTGRKKPAAPTKREISAGGVVYRRDGDEIEVVLASRRTRRGELAWGLAKGGIEEAESAEDAAVREVREETGLLAEIEASLGETRYFYVWENVRIRKTVHFFLMRHTGGNVEDRDDEMEEIRWFPLERALKRAAYRGERDVLGRAAEMLR
jgi:8-oxo-dGTP pyrophosphatase MutT (NUDIX family)